MIPSCLVPLLGRDILQKLRATICLSPSSPLSTSTRLILHLSTPSTPTPDDLPTVDPQVWDTSEPIIASHLTPVQVQLKDNSKFPSSSVPYFLSPPPGPETIIERL